MQIRSGCIYICQRFKDCLESELFFLFSSFLIKFLNFWCLWKFFPSIESTFLLKFLTNLFYYYKFCVQVFCWFNRLFFIYIIVAFGMTGYCAEFTYLDDKVSIMVSNIGEAINIFGLLCGYTWIKLYLGLYSFLLLIHSFT